MEPMVCLPSNTDDKIDVSWPLLSQLGCNFSARNWKRKRKICDTGVVRFLTLNTTFAFSKAISQQVTIY